MPPKLRTSRDEQNLDSVKGRTWNTGVGPRPGGTLQMCADRAPPGVLCLPVELRNTNLLTHAPACDMGSRCLLSWHLCLQARSAKRVC